MTKKFEELIVWQKAHQMVLSIYRMTVDFPKSETFGLTQQFRKAAVSVAANIAEGYKKLGKADKLRFLNMAQGSLEECRYYLILSNDLQYASTKKQFEQLEEVSKLLDGYMSAIRKSMTER